MLDDRATDALFPRLLGAGFDALPAPIRALHTMPLPHRFEGRATVQAARGVLAALVARMLGFPLNTVEAPVAVTIERDGDGEIWTRHFPPRPMRSRLWSEDGLLCEQLGPLLLRFRLDADATGITWQPVAMRMSETNLPALWLKQVEARESVDAAGRYAFFVRGALPWIGPLIGYEGWLDTTAASR